MIDKIENGCIHGIWSSAPIHLNLNTKLFDDYQEVVKCKMYTEIT